jgi:alkylated DNA nucleotide flippase Atl1
MESQPWLAPPTRGGRCRGRVLGERSRAAQGADSRTRQLDPGRVVPTYGDIDAAAPRLVGHVLSTTHDLPWQRVVRSDGSIPQGKQQRDLLLNEGVPMRGDRVDLRQARLPAELS